MSAPNENTLWARAIVEECVRAGVEGVCIAPGSRSTPLTVAFAGHDAIEVFSHLDERSAAFFALGRAKRTGRPTPVVSTSGTAAANFHPAVIEADRARVPMLVLTADRPPELQDSGANQTVDQTRLYGPAVRKYRTLPEPGAEPRRVRSLRTAIARALATSVRTPAGPVHLDVPFAKPLEPVEVPGSVPDDWETEAPLAAAGRSGGFVSPIEGRPELPAAERRRLLSTLSDAERGLIVLGPADAPTPSREALHGLARATGFPVLADPLSGGRFGSHVEGEGVLVCGGYDAYIDAARSWPEPDVVLRFGASPTSKPLRRYLRDVGARQFLIDPAGEWREAEFTATDLVTAAPTSLAAELAGRLEDPGGSDWRERFARAEAVHWSLVDETRADEFFEGAVLAGALEAAPSPATVLVSNSMPVRDLDRFVRPGSADLTVLGNRGASGIDGITSTGLGAGSATDDPLIIVTGDLAYYHDMNGLLAVERCGVEATVVEINNDGGGIFHMLPIEEYDPPFTEQFKTPHGLDFEPSGELYDLGFRRVDTLDAFESAYGEALEAQGSHVIEVRSDAESSHRIRETLEARVVEALRDGDVGADPYQPG